MKAQKKSRSLPMPSAKITGCKGQATVEFILTLVVALLIITVIILPSYDKSSNYVLDVSNLAKLRVSADKLADALQHAYVSGSGTKQTIEAVVPQSATLSCENCLGSPVTCQTSGTLNSVVMTYTLLSKQSSPSCVVDADPDNGQSCKKVFQTGIASGFTCSQLSFPQGIYTMAVQKSDTGQVSVTGTKIG